MFIQNPFFKKLRILRSENKSMSVVSSDGIQYQLVAKTSEIPKFETDEEVTMMSSAIEDFATNWDSKDIVIQRKSGDKTYIKGDFEIFVKNQI